MQILVLGPHRSGTSTVTRLITLMGAYAGEEKDMLKANEENPKGFWERKDALMCNDALLASQHCEWDCLTHWNMQRQPVMNADVLHRMQAVIAPLDAHQPWVMKDPRLCITLPYWKPYLNRPVAVVVYRDPLEVARSLHTRNGMSLHAGLALWEYSAVGLLNASRGMHRVFVHYADLVQRPELAVQKLYNKLKTAGVEGLNIPSAEKIQEFIDAKYYRSKVAEASTPEVLNAAQRILIAYHSGETPPPQEPLAVSYASVEAMRFHSLMRERRENESQHVVLLQAYSQMQTSHAQLEMQHENLAQKHRELLRREEHLQTELNALAQRQQQLIQSAEATQFQLNGLLRSTTWRLMSFPARMWKRMKLF